MLAGAPRSHRRPLRRRLLPRARADRGDMAVELVLVTPIVFFTILLLVQSYVWYNAQQVVTTAAQEGARAARVATADPAAAAAAGRTRAIDYVAILGDHIVQPPTVTVTRDTTTVTVTITADTVSIVPGLAMHVKGKATSPVEVFQPHT